MATAVMVPFFLRALGRALVPLGAFLLVSTAWLSLARAQGNYRSLPMGGRSALLGNTGVALSRDTSAAFLNPATLSAIDNPSVAFSMNTFRVSYFSYGTWYQPGPVDEDNFGSLQSSGLTRVAFSTVPNSLCLYLVLGADPFNGQENEKRPAGIIDKRPRLAFCYANTDVSNIDIPSKNYEAPMGSRTTQFAQAASLRFTRYALGPTLAIPLSDTLSFGGSLHVIVSDMDQSITSNTVTYQGATGISTSLTYLKSGVSIDAAALLGFTWTPSKKTTVGFSLYTPSVPIYGLYAGSELQSSAGASTNTSTLATEQGFFRAVTPLRMQTGVGFNWGRLRLEIDAFMALAEKDAFRVEADGASATQSRTVIERTNGNVTNTRTAFLHEQGASFNLNGAIGGEYFVNPGTSLLGGFYTDISPIQLSDAKPNLSDFVVASKSRVALTFGIGSYGDLGDVLFGTELSYIWGKVAAPNQLQLPPSLDWSNMNGFQMTFVLSGSTNIKVLKRAVDQVQTLVVGPKVEPAKDGKDPREEGTPSSVQNPAPLR
jgi:hypothetical protein